MKGKYKLTSSGGMHSYDVWTGFKTYQVLSYSPMHAARKLSRELQVQKGQRIAVKDKVGAVRQYEVGRNPSILTPMGVLSA